MLKRPRHGINIVTGVDPVCGVESRHVTKCWLRLFSKPWSVTLEQVVHLLIAEQLVFVRLLKINTDWSRNLLPVSVHSWTVLLQRCPIEHNLSVIAFFFFFSFSSVSEPFFLLPGATGAQQRCYSCAARCGQSRSPGANQRTYISLDCVSGRLLDKDHNMTLFLFCAGSVNRRKAPAAQRAPVQDIDHRSQT